MQKRIYFFVRLMVIAICSVNSFFNSVVAQGLPSSQINLPGTKSVFPLYWLGDSIGGSWSPYTALLIPIRIDHCPLVLYMQFDTGSPYSMLYATATQSIQSRYPGALPQQNIAGKLHDFACTAGRTPIRAREIVVA